LIDVGRDVWLFVNKGGVGFLRGAWIVPKGAEKGSYGIYVCAWVATSSRIVYNRRVVSTIASFTVRSGDLQYPSESWRRIWYVYSDSPADPWVQFLDSTEDGSDLNFDSDWGRGRVKYGLADKIGSVSSRIVSIPPGSWTFTVGGDDGIRLYIDGELVISEWEDQSYATYTYARTFTTAANHLLRLEWYENEGDAHVSFDMRQSGSAHDGPEI